MKGDIANFVSVETSEELNEVSSGNKKNGMLTIKLTSKTDGKFFFLDKNHACKKAKRLN